MLVYNVSARVEDEVAAEWLDWMKSVHIPEVMETGLFKDHALRLLLNDPLRNDQGGSCYIIQYYAESLNDYQKYEQEYAPELQKKHKEKYGDKVLAFRTIMQDV